MKHILIASDLSPEALRPFEMVVRMAKAAGSKLTLLHVVQDLIVAPHGAPLAPPVSSPELPAELERVRSMMAPLSTEHPHPISIMIPPVFPALRMDRRALRNILANLLANAVQYSGKGAEIWLIASHHADGVTIEVRDNGVGIPPGDLKRIMQPFERAGDPSFANVEGIGLGLSIAQEMAALHGAGITLESTPEKGTVASLNVPRTRVVTDRTADRSDNGETRLARASTRA